MGYVVFKESSARDSALKMDPSVSRFLSTPSCPITTGMKSIRRQKIVKSCRQKQLRRQGNLGSGVRQTDRLTDRQTDR